MDNQTIDHPLANDIRAYSRFGPALSSAVRTLFNALLLPIFLLVLAWQMAPAYELMTLKGSVHHALLCIIPVLFLALFLQHSFRRNGLAEKHFGWSAPLCGNVYNGMLCVVWMVLPLKFFCESLGTFQNGAWYDSLGRLFFVAALIGCSTSLFFICRGINRWREEVLQREGLARTRAQRRQYRKNLLNGGPIDVDMLSSEGWKSSMRRLALNVVALLPMVFVGLSVAGFHFTAMQMTVRAIWTVLLSGLVAIVAGLISRMLLVTQFRVKLQQLKRNDSGHIGEDESINITDISSQVNRLLRATAIVAVVVIGWQIWSEVSPTIRYLDSLELGSIEKIQRWRGSRRSNHRKPLANVGWNSLHHLGTKPQPTGVA